MAKKTKVGQKEAENAKFPQIRIITYVLQLYRHQ